MRVAVVIWSASVGGAERLTAELAARLRERGVDAQILFITTEGGALTRKLHATDVPYTSLGLRRGRELPLNSVAFARAVERLGGGNALLAASGIMARSLRLGRFHGRITAIEHGNWLQTPSKPRPRRALEHFLWRTGARAVDVQCAVSDYMLRVIRARTHAERTLRIYNGIDLKLYRPGLAVTDARANAVVGFAGRLVPGKGVEDLLRAFARGRIASTAELWIAGDGPMRRNFEDLALHLGIRPHVQFLGMVEDMADFWRQVDVAVVPSNGWIESFCLSAVEAMACGVPVIATSTGALPETVVHGETGTLVEPGDQDALGEAVARYLDDSVVRARHGDGGTRRCRETFDIERTADQYFDLLAQGRGG